MVEEKNSKGWVTMLVISILFIVWVLFMMSAGNGILPKAFELAESSQLTSDIEEKALAFMNMTMLKPLWEEIWIGIFGLFIAFGLKKYHERKLRLQGEKQPDPEHETDFSSQDTIIKA